MTHKIKYMLLSVLIVATIGSIHAQDVPESPLQQEYRQKVLQYNQDMKSAEYNIEAHRQMENTAKADFKPKLSAGGTFNYTGNPMELSLDLPSFGAPLSFSGRNMSYGASATLMQPVYAGGAIRENYRMSKSMSEVAVQQSDLVSTDVVYQSDVKYWSAVARDEMVQVVGQSRESVGRLVEVVRHRVEQEYANRNDLLMAEVRLNEADYRLMQAQNDYQVARMSMNSFAGVPLDQQLPADTTIIAITAVASLTEQMVTAVGNRPEINIAREKVAIEQSSLRLNDAQFKPKLYVGLDGSYSSPGNDFRADLDPNYVAYAKLSVPIFEWGKRKSTKRTSQLRVGMAEQSLSKVEDIVDLELQAAYYNYSQAVGRVTLTENSLRKADENQAMAMERYREGNVSIIEALDAQMYHQQAQINYIQSKMNAQISRSAFVKALGSYSQK